MVSKRLGSILKINHLIIVSAIFVSVGIVSTITPNSPTSRVVALAPAVVNINPSIGLPAGGEKVIIQGSNFEPTGMSVDFGGVLATGVRYISPNFLEVVTPPNSTGRVDVKVANSLNETSIMASGYSYELPTVPELTGVLTNSGSILGGDSVNFQGNNLNNQKWKQIDTGESHTCAISLDNQTYCWGKNDYYQLGNDYIGHSSLPINVKFNQIYSNVFLTSISGGSGYTCGLGSDGWAYCWGYNASGQLGNGSTETTSIPTPIARGAIPESTTLVSIEASYDHTCGLGSDGWAYCWGSGSSGALGDGMGASSSLPVAVARGAVPAGVTLSALSSGLGTTFALGSNGWVYSWGRDQWGQLGNDSGLYDWLLGAESPVAIHQGSIPVGVKMKLIASGSEHACAVGDDEQIYCWGGGGYAKGDGSSGLAFVPITSSRGGIPSGEKIVQIAAGYNSTCALSSGKKTYCWGNNSSGELGLGDTSARATPTLIQQGDIILENQINLVSTSLASESHSCALDDKGFAYCWGSDFYGALGTGSGEDSNDNGYRPDKTVPSGVNPNYTIKFGKVSTSQGLYSQWLNNNNFSVISPSNSVGVIDISLQDASQNPVKAVSDLELAYEYLSEEPKITAVEPSRVLAESKDSLYAKVNGTNLAKPMPLGNITQISAGPDATCAVGEDGWAYCWGKYKTWNTYSSQLNPTPIKRGAIPVGATIEKISSSMNMSFYAIASDGWVYCWDEITDNPAPISRGAIPEGVTIVDLSSYYSHTCALASDGWVYCWGSDSYGQIGDGGSSTTRSTPVPIAQGAIPVGTKLTGISAGDYHTCATTEAGWVYCWGDNGYGKLGIGTASGNIQAPVEVLRGSIPIGSKVKQVAAGTSETCALTDDNKLYCWGRSKNTPTVKSLDNVAAGITLSNLTVKRDNFCLIDGNGQSYCWGGNRFGILGNGSIINSAVPVPVDQQGSDDDLFYNQISIGYDHSCAVSSEKRVYCWGGNQYGGLGIKSNQTRFTPSAVLKNQTREVRFVSSDGQYSASDYIYSTSNDSLWTRIVDRPIGSVAVQIIYENGERTPDYVLPDNSNRLIYYKLPDAPIITAKQSNAKAKLDWAEPFNGGFPIEDYLIEYCTGDCPENRWFEFKEIEKRWQALASSADGQKLVAGGRYSKIHTSSDGGFTWSPQDGSAEEYWWKIDSSSDGSRIIASPDWGYPYLSTDSGVTWTQLIDLPEGYWEGVTISGDGSYLAAASGWGGYIYTSSDGGVNWTAQSSAGERDWYSISSSQDGKKLAAAVYDGFVYTSDDFGKTWEEHSEVGEGSWRDIEVSGNGNTIIVVDEDDNKLLVSNDFGGTWITHPNLDGLDIYWESVASSYDGSILLASSDYDDATYQSIDSGVTWSRMETDFGSYGGQVTLSSDGKKMAIATNWMKYIYVSNPSNWSDLENLVSTDRELMTHNLLPETTYYFRGRSKTEAAIGNYGEITPFVMGLTGDDTEPETPDETTPDTDSEQENTNSLPLPQTGYGNNQKTIYLIISLILISLSIRVLSRNFRNKKILR